MKTFEWKPKCSKCGCVMTLAPSENHTFLFWKCINFFCGMNGYAQGARIRMCDWFGASIAQPQADGVP